MFKLVFNNNSLFLNLCNDKLKTSMYFGNRLTVVEILLTIECYILFYNSINRIYNNNV